LRIPPCDCPRSTPILEIAPNRFTVAGPRPGQLQTTFRSHPKYSKRLYFAFRPLWWAMHAWDWIVADRFAWADNWSFGFEILTVYPDPDPEVTSVDGEAWRWAIPGETWDQIRLGAGNAARDYNEWDSPAITHQPQQSGFTSLDRTFLLFDTSSLGNNVTIETATLSVWGTNHWGGLGKTDFHIVATTPASNTAIVAADYQQVGGTSFGSVAFDSYTHGAYSDVVLSAAGRENINKTGVSKFGSRLGWDLSGVYGGSYINDATYFVYQSADVTGTAQDPKLVVVHQPAIIFLKRSDTVAVAAADARQVAVFSGRSDTASIGLAGAQQSLLSSSRMETAALALAEGSRVDVVLQQLSRADAVDAAIADVSGLLISEIVELARADTVAPAFAEASALERFDPLRELISLDPIGVSAVEGPAVVLNMFQGADAAAIVLDESAQLLKFSLPAPSTLRVGSWLRPAS
jgi:hypothetical protein